MKKVLLVTFVGLTIVGNVFAGKFYLRAGMSNPAALQDSARGLLNCSPDISNFSVTTSNVYVAGGSIVTISSTSLGNGSSFHVIYNITGANTSANDTAVITVAANTATFFTPANYTAGNTTLTITGIYSSSTCSAVVSANNTAVFKVVSVPSITFNPIVAICPGVSSFTIGYTAVNANQYTISGANITPVTNGQLSGSGIIRVSLSSTPSPGILPFIVTIRDSTSKCAFVIFGDSVKVAVTPAIAIDSVPAITTDSLSFSIPYNSTTSNQYSITGNLGSGIVAVTNGVLAAGPSSIKVLLSAGANTAGTKNFTLTIRDSTATCISTSINDSIVIKNTTSVTLSMDTSFTAQMNYIYANLNKDSIPTGILLNRAMDFVNVAAYNGVGLADSTKTNYGTVMGIYNTLATGMMSAKAATAGTFYHPVYVDSILQTIRTAGTITLTGLYYQYAAFLPNAVSSNLITVSNNQLHDNYVNGVWQNPYQKQNVFAVSPSINKYNSLGTYSLSVVLPAALWLTNSATSVNSITANFGDGAGFRTVTPGQSLSLSYSSGGTKTWIFDLNLVNGTVLQSQTDITLDSVLTTTASTINKRFTSGLCSINAIKKFNYNFHYGDLPYHTYPIVSNATYAGDTKPATGWYTIAYGHGHTTIQKPLLVVEGFDPGSIISPEDAYGINNIFTFIGNSASSIAAGEWNFSSPSGNLNTLINGGYDIIYVDWGYSEDYIQNNALLLEKIINTVNSLSGNAPITILAQSMGSLCTRWALTDMEKHTSNPPHNVKTFISWDGPQQGVNVPIAYQFASRAARSLYVNSNIPNLLNVYSSFIRPIYVGTVGVQNFLRSLSNASYYYSSNTQSVGLTPAAIIGGALGLQDLPSPRQMLINYVTPNDKVDNTVHAAWQKELTTIGYPVQSNNIVVSNGSECAATETFKPGDAMIDVRGNGTTQFLGDALGSMVFSSAGVLLNNPTVSFLGSLPGSSTFNLQFTCNAQPDGVKEQQFIGKISYTKNVLNLFSITTNIINMSVASDPSILPYDYFPGGEYPVDLGLTGSSSNSANLIQAAFGKYNITVNANQQSFCFVPTPSALDLGKGTVALTEADYLTPYVGAQPPPAPKNTPFSAFVTAFNTTSSNTNEDHIEISGLNGDWVNDELTGLPTPGNCTAFCNYAGQIIGDAHVCMSNPYYISSLPPNATVNWYASPSGILIMNPSVTTSSNAATTVTEIGSGAVTLEAEINTASCGAPVWIILNVIATATNPAAPTFIRVQSQPGTKGYFANSGTYYVSNEVGSEPGTGPNGTDYNVGGFEYYEVSTDNVNWSAEGPPPMPYVGCDQSLSLYVRAVGCTGNLSPVTHLVVRAQSQSICFPKGSAQRPAYDSSGLDVDTSSDSKAIVMNAYPNPANDVISISLKDDQGNSLTQNINEVDVVDMSGALIKEQRFASNQAVNIDVSSIPDGIYILHVFDGSTWRTEKISKLSNPQLHK